MLKVMEAYIDRLSTLEQTLRMVLYARRAQLVSMQELEHSEREIQVECRG